MTAAVSFPGDGGAGDFNSASGAGSDVVKLSAPESVAVASFRGVGMVKEASLSPLKSASSSRSRLEVNLSVRDASPDAAQSLFSRGEEARRAG